MKEITIKAHAKINLSLAITGIREDGYHLLDTVMASVGIYDTLKLQPAEGFFFACAGGAPAGEDNLVVRAAKSFFGAANMQAGVNMELVKRIPSQAGMGGGSADAAAALVGLNHLFGQPLSQKELLELGLKLGADVPFCMAGGMARCRGVGEEMQPFNAAEPLELVIIKPPKGLSTPQVFRQWDMSHTPAMPDNDALCSLLQTGKASLAAQQFINTLQQPAEELCPQIAQAIAALEECGALKAFMTGSGSAVVGMFADGAAAKLAAVQLGAAGWNAWADSTWETGLEIAAE